MTFLESNMFEQMIVAVVCDLRLIPSQVPLYEVDGKNHWRVIMDAHRPSPGYGVSLVASCVRSAGITHVTDHDHTDKDKRLL